MTVSRRRRNVAVSIFESNFTLDASKKIFPNDEKFQLKFLKKLRFLQKFQPKLNHYINNSVSVFPVKRGVVPIIYVFVKHKYRILLRKKTNRFGQNDAKKNLTSVRKQNAKFQDFATAVKRRSTASRLV